MRSSTSSSSQRLPTGTWRPKVLGATLIVLAFVASFELYLGHQGLKATVSDSARLWSQARARANRLNDHALILVGNSRMQLDIDLGVLRQQTGLEPVQLAIDASSSFIPVLENLAADPHIDGTILIAYMDADLTNELERDRTRAFVADYSGARDATVPFYHAMEATFDDALRSSLRSYGDGAKPLTTFDNRVLSERAAPQYLTMLSDRSVSADYSKVPVLEAYFNHLERHLGNVPSMPEGATYADLEKVLRSRIEAIVPLDNTQFLLRVAHVKTLIETIQAHGGKIMLTVLPSSGLEREIERRRNPRALYWEPMVAALGVPHVHFEDDAELAAFVCPDGSHLDFRDRKAFTTALVHALRIASTPKISRGADDEFLPPAVAVGAH